MKNHFCSGLLGFLLIAMSAFSAYGQSLASGDRVIEPSRIETLAAQARLQGDPQRGALVFFKSAAACANCHASGGDEASPLGPDLTTIAKEMIADESTTQKVAPTKTLEESIVESILHPSRVIRDAYETVNVVTVDGEIRSGLVAARTDSHLVLRDAKDLENEIRIPLEEIEEIVVSKQSMMPEGLAASLLEERDLLDLVRYVSEVARGGNERASQLRPRPEDLIVRDDTLAMDHASILESLNDEDFQNGRRIYMGHCKNCHGADGNTPTMATARAFGTEPLKYGDDPYKMLQTLTRGAGLMASVQHLTPNERYQVIHFIREKFMKPDNPVYREIDADYLSGLPKGTRRNDETELVDRDYGPALGSQIGSEINNALTLRLSDDVSVSYDLHRMRLAGVWTDGFLDLSQTQHYRQRGERMPQIEGELVPGLADWGWAFGDSFEISPELKPPRGPVKNPAMNYRGHYLHDERVVLSYEIQGRGVLETVDHSRDGEKLQLTHSLRIEPGDNALQLSVGQLKPNGSPIGMIDSNDRIATVRDGIAGDSIAFVCGGHESMPDRARMANRALHVVAGETARQLDLGTPGRTTLVRFRTENEGTLVASTPRLGGWKPDGKTLFIRGKRLVFDIGWLGAMTGRTDVADGEWHVAALVVTEGETRLYVDGQLEATRDEFRRDPVRGHVLKIGATANDFGGDFQGEIEWVRIVDSELTPEQLTPDALVKSTEADSASKTESLFQWQSSQQDLPPTPENPLLPGDAPVSMVAAAVGGDVEAMRWTIDESGRIVLSIPPSDRVRTINVVRCSADLHEQKQVVDALRAAVTKPVTDPAEWLGGGDLRWPEVIEVQGRLGEPINGYALDTITIPFDNPWNAWMRTSGLDFFSDGRAVVSTHGGDVYIVSGIDAQLDRVRWKRFAAGLFEPFGVRVIDETIYVICRDGIKRLHDFNEDDEADFIEAFWNDDDVSSMFHAYNFDLQTDSQGNFYFAKAGQYTRHHRPGTIMRIPPEGGRADVFAWGFRTPNGMGKLFDDRFTVSDNQGPWMPAGKISLIRQDRFFGNMPITDEQTTWLKKKHGGELPSEFEQPIVWMPQELDNSCGGQVWIDDERFGPLSGRLIHSSFGKGWLYYLSLQEVADQTQASIVALPHQWGAGVMRLRGNPADGQLYGTGLSGWQGPADGADGCLQRLRYTGQPTKMIESTRVTSDGIERRFNFAVDAETARDPQSWQLEMWDYRWSRQYGSDQYSVLRPGEKGRDDLIVQSVTQVDDRTLRLLIPNLSVCDQVSLKVNFKEATGERFVEHLYLTINAMPSG